jgi:hypothetical protein
MVGLAHRRRQMLIVARNYNKVRKLKGRLYISTRSWEYGWEYVADILSLKYK